MKKRGVAFLVSILCSLSACQSSQPTVSIPKSLSLVAEQNQQTVGSDIHIPFKKFRLENGLTVILHEDHSDPLVHVDVTYHVGSAREELGRTGFAHFFEHMMFQGSKHVADEQHFAMVTESGGSMNGTTNTDRTNYYQTVPANQLERMLWLESDRMGFLLEAVTQEKFEIQRETVKNERAQRVDNAPYGLISERVGEALYPAGHPYSWQPIGYIEDLNRVQVDALKQFFSRWYGPNNAVLTIGGDINVNQTLQWVEKYFGSIPKGPEVKPMAKQPVTLAETRYITLEDNIPTPLIYFAFPTVYARHADEAALDVLSNILGRGKTSLMYQGLVKSGNAVSAVAGHPCQELACSFTLYALPNKQRNMSLAQLETQVRDSLKAFETRGVTQADIDKTVSFIEATSIYGLQSVAGKVSSLAANETFEGKPDLAQDELARYAAVKPADVMRVYNTYIKNKPAVILSVVPKGKTELAASQDIWVFPGRELPEQLTANTATEYRTTPETFDRSKPPAAGRSQTVYLPEIWEKKVATGVTMYGTQSTEVPTTSLIVSMEGGPLLDPEGKYGVAQLTAAMMNESSKAYTAEQMTNEMERLGTSISFSSGGRYFSGSLTSLTKHLDESLLLFMDRLFNPAFKEEEFNLVKQRMLQGLQRSLVKPGVMASRTIKSQLFGSDSRLGHPDEGSMASLAAITLDDVKAYYANYVTTAHMSVFVVGDLSAYDYKQKLNFLSSFNDNAYDIPEFSLPQWRSEPRIFLIDKPKAPQSVVRFFKPSHTFDFKGVQFKSGLMNFPLGGSFNSRLNLVLREQKGYTYGANSGFYAGKSTGQFQFSANVKADQTLNAITDALSLIDVYREQGMTDEELTVLKSAYTESDALSFETPGQKAGYIRRKVSFDLPDNFVDQQNRVIQSIDKAALNALAKTELDANSMDILVVGDKETLLPQLETLGRKIEIISVVN